MCTNSNRRTLSIFASKAGSPKTPTRAPRPSRRFTLKPSVLKRPPNSSVKRTPPSVVVVRSWVAETLAQASSNLVPLQTTSATPLAWMIFAACRTVPATVKPPPVSDQTLDLVASWPRVAAVVVRALAHQGTVTLPVLPPEAALL